jgi:hypothetical protein
LQGCQMVYFHTKNLNFVILCSTFKCKMLDYFMSIWYILGSCWYYLWWCWCFFWCFGVLY